MGYPGALWEDRIGLVAGARPFRSRESREINTRQTRGRRYGFLRASRGGDMSWADLFERASEYETTVEHVRETLSERRDDA